jgi:hypothetical protein
VFRRYTLLLLLLVLVMALVVPAGADRDDNMIVGRSNGGKAYNTSLYSTNNTATLSLHNKNGSGAPALSLHSNKGPALAVNTSAWIRRLNADYVDGYQANALVRADGCGHTNAANGTDYECTFKIEAPKPGIVVLAGSAETTYLGLSSDTVNCQFEMSSGMGYTTVGGTDRNVSLADDAGTWDHNCGTNGIVELETAGSYWFKFRLYSVGSSTSVMGVIATGIYTPFDGLGELPD